ncbi:MAG: class I SAM-dependent methyltransferase [Limisphaerales bacterium]|jgi:ubiquinone/menaquinone biosynthesis C-methylase UbiE
MSFDPLAPHYRWLESLIAGRLLQQARTRWIHHLPQPQKILLAGEGPGRFLEIIASLWPNARFYVIDASSAMLNQARNAWLHHQTSEARVHWIHAALPLSMPPIENCDLIATHFFLDCFPPDTLEKTIHRLGQAASKTASWLISDFHIPPSGWRRTRSRLLLNLMYPAFQFLTQLPANHLANPAPYLHQSGFKLHKQQLSNHQLIRSEWWQRPSP